MSRRMTTLKLFHKQPESRQMTHLLRVFLSYDNLVITLEQLNNNLKQSNDSKIRWDKIRFLPGVVLLPLHEAVVFF